MNIKSLMISAAMVSAVMTTSVSLQASANEKDNTASFLNFFYTGNDDFYNANRLPDNSSFYNPILPGWYSDPSVCDNGKGDYFLVTSTFSYYPGVPIFHSRDLLNWRQIGHVLDRPSQLSHLEGQHVSGGIFAPAISYNPNNGTYYMITTDVGSGNFLVKTKDPFGSWSDPIYLPEIKGIDPSLFFDDNGKAYIVNNDDAPAMRPEYDGHRTIRIMEYDVENDRCIGSREIIVNKGVNPEEKPIWCEGPHMYKLDGKYYLMTAEGGTAENHSEVIYRSESPFGPFIPWEGNPILTQRGLPAERENAVTCAGHADIIQAPDGKWYSFFLACRPQNGFENLGRETFILPMEWTSDGWPVITKKDEPVAMISSVAGAERTGNLLAGNFSVNDEFDSTELGLEWISLRGDASGMYSLTDRKGALNIKCADISASEKKILPYLGRRIQHHKFEAKTRLDFSPRKEGEKAGMLVFKDESHHYFLAKEKRAGKNRVTLYEMTPEGLKDCGSAAIGNKHVIDLKTVSDGKTFSFYVSTDKGRNWRPVATGKDARYTSTANAGGFTGTTIGLHATSR